MIRIIREIKRYILGRPKGILKLGTITIEQVFRTRDTGIALLYLVMCGNLRKTRSRSYNEMGSNKEMPQI